MSAELIADLQRTRELLTEQLDAITGEASAQGVLREHLRDTTGGFIAAPVLVALANVQVALLAQGAASCTCSRVPPRVAYDCPVHGHG